MDLTSYNRLDFRKSSTIDRKLRTKHIIKFMNDKTDLKNRSKQIS